MGGFFAVEYAGPPFELFGAPHIGALSCVVFLNLGWIAFRAASGELRSMARGLLTAGLWLAEAAWHIWNLHAGTWTIRTMLPLNLCSLFIWLSGFMLLFRQYRIYEFAYFLGIGAAVQYLATPDLGPYGFPHFRFFQAFVSHGLLLTAPVYMSIVEGFRPTVQSLIRVVGWTNLYALAVYVINGALGSDYLMLNAKPATPSLLDLLPPWPLYLLYVELIGLLTCMALLVPFIRWSSVGRFIGGAVHRP